MHWSLEVRRGTSCAMDYSILGVHRLGHNAAKMTQRGVILRTTTQWRHSRRRRSRPRRFHTFKVKSEQPKCIETYKAKGWDKGKGIDNRHDYMAQRVQIRRHP